MLEFERARRDPIVWRRTVQTFLLSIAASEFFIFTRAERGVDLTQPHNNVLILTNSPVFDALVGLIFSFVLASGVASFEISAAPKLRSWPFLAAVVGVGAAYATVIVSGIFLSLPIARGIYEGKAPWNTAVIRGVLNELLTRPMLQAYATAYIALLLLTFLTELSRKLGPGVLWKWLLGRYREPRIEERVFLFIDLKNSTQVAERLGDRKYSAFIRDFFHDITIPVLTTQGEVLHYVGDEVVINWPPARAFKKANCIACYFMLHGVIEGRKAAYCEIYGVYPEFRAALHCGQVVATEVGTLKSEIVYHGDVMNTTSRILAACKEVGEDFLVSSQAARAIGSPPNLEIVECGKVQLRGKSSSQDLFAVRPASLAPEHAPSLQS